MNEGEQRCRPSKSYRGKTNVAQAHGSSKYFEKPHYQHTQHRCNSRDSLCLSLSLSFFFLVLSLCPSLSLTLSLSSNFHGGKDNAVKPTALANILKRSTTNTLSTAAIASSTTNTPSTATIARSLNPPPPLPPSLSQSLSLSLCLFLSQSSNGHEGRRDAAKRRAAAAMLKNPTVTIPSAAVIAGTPTRTAL